MSVGDAVLDRAHAHQPGVERDQLVQRPKRVLLPTPAPGDWRGLWFGGIPQAANVLDHVRIEYAGYDCGCSRVTCSAIEDSDAAVIFSWQPPSAFITNTVFKDIAGHAVMEGFDGSLVDFRPTNTFEGVAGCIQTMPRPPTTSCPAMSRP